MGLARGDVWGGRGTLGSPDPTQILGVAEMPINISPGEIFGQHSSILHTQENKWMRNLIN